MKVCDVLIIVEHKARELESACLLKIEFERRGFTCIIESIFPNKEILPIKYKADIIILPWGYSNRDMRYISCYLKNSPNAKIVNMHHEQYSGQDDDNICLSTGEARKLFHISWGKKFTEGLIDNGCKKEQIFTVGNIRLDFYSKYFARLSVPKEEMAQKFGLDIEKKWVLFIADGFHLMDKRKLDSISTQDSFIYEKADVATKCRKDFLKFVSCYLENNRDVIFVYRPHPVYAYKDIETKEIKALRKKYKGSFFASAELPIRDWILNVDACYSFHSTTNVECYSSNTPYYLFRTEQLREELDYPFFVDYKYTIHSYSEFVKSLNNKVFDKSIIEYSLIDYYLLDEKLVYNKIIDSIINTQENEKIELKKKDYIYNYIRAGIKVIIHNLARIKFFENLIINTDDNRWFRIIGKDDDTFSKQDIEKIESALKECVF